MEDGIKVAILVPLSFFALIFGIVYLRSREKLSMIERGMDPRTRIAQPVNRNYTLTMGLLLIGAGLGLFIADRIAVGMPFGYDPTAIYFSLITLFGGLGLFTAYLIEKRDAKKEKEEQKQD
jgi:hypothetical protein